ncbi:MAG: hydrogenase expression/formation protein HypE [Chloroflexota bacterium]|nr:MAG: hydrogenase expression/formation protein HypE [Chloroflexota bacterium]
MTTGNDKILLAHGSGGQLSHELVERLFLRYFDNPILAHLDDSAVLEVGGGMQEARGKKQEAGFLHPASRILHPAPDARLAFTTDSYVVSPIFFPGGDIGKLAVCGTINDLAMSGATPLYLSAGFIIEEGLELAALERVVASMAATAQAAGVQIVAGDTKVVDRGKADRLFINTAGVGVVPAGVELGSDQARPGDVIILSGTIGDHGMTIMSQREGLRFDSPLASDCAPLHGLVAAVMEVTPQAVHCLRDPTRGGLATTLNEVADKSRVGIEIEEDTIPVRDAVRAACELLGLDPLYVANEGKLVAFVAPEAADAVLTRMQAHEYGREAAIIGRVTAEHAGRVVLRTALGARRILDMLVGEQLPRIC